VVVSPSPQSTAEKSAEDAPGVNVVGSRALSVHATARDSKKFVFDRVFNDGESQQVVFREVSPLVTSTLDGYVAFVFVLCSSCFLVAQWTTLLLAVVSPSWLFPP